MTIIEASELAGATGGGGNPLVRAAVHRLVESVGEFAKGGSWAREARNAIIINMSAIKRESGVSVKTDVPWQALGGRTLREALGWTKP